MMNYELKQALRPVKMKIRRNRFLRGTVTGLAAGLGTAVLLQAVSFFVPVPDRGLWAAAAGAAVLLLTAIGNALRPVKNNTAAEAADACGLKERVITALEEGQRTSGSEGDIVLLQRKDACAALEGLDFVDRRSAFCRRNGVGRCRGRVCRVFADGCVFP